MCCTLQADTQAQLLKLRRVADDKLRKERQLAATRLTERDSLARQVVQLQAQLRHVAATDLLTYLRTY